MPAEPFKFDGVFDNWKIGQILRFCQKSALDIGCNTGEYVAHLNKINIKAAGIDSNQDFITEAKNKFPDIKFYQGIDLSIFPDNSFESVIAWNVLEHIEEDSKALSEMLRIAQKNVILSVPKEDNISLPDSRVTYRPYVDPTHKHYYTRAIMQELISNLGEHKIYFEDTTRVRPLLAYKKIGIPSIICTALDNIFWNIGKNKEIFYANLMVIIEK